MKKKWAVLASVLLFVTTVGVSPPVIAASWQTWAWNDMLKLAPEGSIALGRVYTLSQIQKTCRLLDGGIGADEILDGVVVVAMRSGYDSQQQEEMFVYGVSTVLVAGKRLCPRHLSEIWLAINLMDG